MRKLIYTFLMFPIINTIGSWIYKFLRLLCLFKSELVFPYKGIVNVALGVNQFKMYSDGNDTIASRIFQDGTKAFEPEMKDVFEKLILSSNIFLDVGANTGFYSLFASALNKDCTVHAFEPVPAIYNSLNHNISLNNAYNIIIHKIALSNATQISSFFVPDSIRTPTGASQVPQFQNCIEIPCQLKKLDEFVAESAISCIDLMKVDTETTEPLVIEGGLQSISKFRPVIIIEILNDNVAINLESFFVKLDYSYFHILPERIHQVSSLQVGNARGSNWNFLLIPNEKMDTINL